MKLVKLSYEERDWKVNNLELDNLNLIVAKNATGKSRTIYTIQKIARILIDSSFDDVSIDGNVILDFKKGSSSYIRYNFEFENKLCISERLEIDGKTILERDENGSAVIYSNDGNEENVFPPKNKLVLQTNRDLKRHPYFESLIEWAENSHEFIFSIVTPSFQPPKFESQFFSKSDDFPSMFKKLNEIGQDLVRTQFNTIGYQIEKITSITIGKSDVLSIEEKNSLRPVEHYFVSQGMYRSLALIIYLEYLIELKNPAMVIIDDLCEGLDYERASKLGKLVFEKCLNSNIQLIATSNDSFLMDVVDIKYWNVLTREGNVVTALNNKNHPKLFEDFRFTGLSNFDFFSSDYINNGGRWSK